ncbi:MAG: Transcription elongation factor GreB [Steroidobacteraceae bacterium]|nr:Transcription elongation factor GreB [Steroidobacteraceae bacterium]
MSRAFVKEGDGAVTLPERAVGPHPNLVTAAGLAQIEAQVRALEAARSAARAVAQSGAVTHDAAALATIERDLRYWIHRRSSARLVTPAPKPDAVRFGVEVTLRPLAGPAAAPRTLRIVGEDEADPARGLLSWVSPAAEKLIGAQVGDEVDFAGARHVVDALR